MHIIYNVCILYIHIPYGFSMDFRGTKFLWFSRIDSHPRKFSPTKIKVHTVYNLVINIICQAVYYAEICCLYIPNLAL